MEIGRGQLFDSFNDYFERRTASSFCGKTMAGTKEIKSHSSRSARTLRGPGSRTAKQMAPKPVFRTPKRAQESSAPIERLQLEMLHEILSYLDASSLFSLSHVNKLFYQLANDDKIWERIYMSEFGRNKRSKAACSDEVALKMGAMKVQDLAVGYWKRLYWRSVAACHMNKWKMRLKHINGLTGLPSQTEQAFRSLNVTWELTVRDESQYEGTFEPSWSRFFQTSVMLCWNGGSWPKHEQISSLGLHGVLRIPLSCPGQQKPCWRSLMEQFDMKALAKSGQVIGRDKTVELIQLQPGVIVGMWKGHSSVAFVMASLHVHGLMEKSTKGFFSCSYVEPVVKPRFDDIDPEYGLHGYQLHIVLHNTARRIMSESFYQLFCRRDEIRDGLIQLTAVGRTKVVQHIHLSGNIALPWGCEALRGSVENCCIMSVTLLDEFKKPFWCVSSAVSMARADETLCYDYDGEHFLIHHQDPDGQVKMKLVRMKDEYLLVSLVVYVSVDKVNQYFGKDY